MRDEQRGEKRGTSLHQQRGKRPRIIAMGRAGYTPLRVLGLLLSVLLAVALAGCGVTNVSGNGAGATAHATATAQAQATARAAVATATAAAQAVRMTITVTEQGTVASSGKLAATATITNATGRAIHLLMPICVHPLLVVTLATATGSTVWDNKNYLSGCISTAQGHFVDKQTVAAGASATVSNASNLTPSDPGPLHTGQTYTAAAQVLWRYQAGGEPGPETPQPVTAQTSITLR